MIYNIFCALMLACIPLSADASAYCKVTDARYIHVGSVGADWWAYWWCDDGQYQWSIVQPDVHDSESQIKAWFAYLVGLNPTQTGQRPWPPADEPRFVALHTAMMNALVADTDRPKPPAWSVAPNGKYPDRPTYPVADGKRGTKSDGRAKVGAACDCATPIVEGRTTYCRMADGGIAALSSAPTGSVAVCVRDATR